VFIQASYKNCIVTVTDQSGNTLSWRSSGSLGNRDTRKGTPFPAQQAAVSAANAAREHGLRSVDVRVGAPGLGRESAVRALAAAGIDVRSIRDVKPIPFDTVINADREESSGPYRPPKRRRINPSNFDQVFLERVNRGAVEILDALNPRDLASAVAAPTDAGVLMVALERSGGIGVLTKDPLAEAKLRGQRRRLQLLELEGGTLTSDDVATLLKISRQAVVKKIDAGTLLGIRLGSSYAIPAWQIENHKLLNGLKQVMRALGGTDEWRKLSFFVNGNVRLSGRSPLQELRAGRQDEVIQAARTLLEHGAS
jgi:small subunit ribosomal protein S11